MAEAGTEQAVDSVRREAEMSINESEANHQAQLRDAQAKLEEMINNLTAKDATIMVSAKRHAEIITRQIRSNENLCSAILVRLRSGVNHSNISILRVPENKKWPVSRFLLID